MTCTSIFTHLHTHTLAIITMLMWTYQFLFPIFSWCARVLWIGWRWAAWFIRWKLTVWLVGGRLTVWLVGGRLTICFLGGRLTIWLVMQRVADIKAIAMLEATLVYTLFESDPVFGLAIFTTPLSRHFTTLYGPSQWGFILSPFFVSLAEFLSQTKLPGLKT